VDNLSAVDGSTGVLGNPESPADQMMVVSTGSVWYIFSLH